MSDLHAALVTRAAHAPFDSILSLRTAAAWFDKLTMTKNWAPKDDKLR
jgi:hypothetical protein